MEIKSEEQILDEKKEYDYEFLKNLPENLYEKYLKNIFKQKMGFELDLQNPKRFNEKIQYLKLYGDMPSKKIYVDKITARDYFLKKIGDSKCLKQVYGIYDKFEDINFGELPEKFYMAVNHGCKMNLKIKNKKLFLEKGYNYAKKQFTGWLNYNFAFCAGFEMQYKEIIPKIIIEKLYENNDGSRVGDFQFYCFDGEPKFIQTIVHSSNRADFKIAFYDLDYNVLPVSQPEKYPIIPIEKPAQFNKMIDFAKILSSEFKFVRVDFLACNNDFYFLELTFTPNSGFLKYYPDEYDYIFGEYLKL